MQCFQVQNKSDDQQLVIRDLLKQTEFLSNELSTKSSVLEDLQCNQEETLQVIIYSSIHFLCKHRRGFISFSPTFSVFFSLNIGNKIYFFSLLKKRHEEQNVFHHGA